MRIEKVKFSVGYFGGTMKKLNLAVIEAIASFAQCSIAMNKIKPTRRSRKGKNRNWFNDNKFIR